MRALLPNDLLDIMERAADEGPTATALRLLATTRDEGLRELARLPIGARDRLLLELRQRSIGGALTASECCPSCGADLELSLEASDLEAGAAAHPEALDPEALIWTRGELRVPFRLPTSEDLLAVERMDDAGEAARLLALRCIESGDALDDEELESLGETMAVADPQADLTLDVSCTDCGHHWERELDLASFFVEELRAVSRHLLAEVDALARGYGWTEADILSMSAWRRRTYVEMLGR